MELQRMIARFVAEPAPFTQQALYLARRSILDTMGAMIAGSETAAVRQALTVTEDGCCTVPGRSEKLCGRDAAFVNGISGHELELDDTSSSNLGHPTVAVLPALLAIGEEAGCSGRLLLEGFLIATEVTCKLGRICAKRLHAKGWHCSSVTAGIGAAAGCAYLLGLSQEQTSHALGIAASMASGLRENFGTQTKSIHIGKCAEDGYRAARLAQAGFTSSTVALEGKEGFLYEYADLREEGDEFHRIMASMGHDWDICAPGFTLKRWPSCSSTHRPVDAIMELIRINQLSAAEIESIRVGLGISALRELVTPDPADGEEAKFSVGFQIGLYLTDRANAPENYNRETIRLPEVQNIIRRTEPVSYTHLAAGAKVVATGRSDFPNQINNLLVFPGIFKGALAARASRITEEMMIAAAYAIAGRVSPEELSRECIIPSTFDMGVADVVAEAVKAHVEH